MISAISAKCISTEYSIAKIFLSVQYHWEKGNTIKNKGKILLISIFYCSFSFSDLQKAIKRKTFPIHRKSSNYFRTNKKREACKDSTHFSDYFSVCFSVCRRVCRGQVHREQVCRAWVCRGQVFRKPVCGQEAAGAQVLHHDEPVCGQEAAEAQVCDVCGGDARRGVQEDGDRDRPSTRRCRNSTSRYSREHIHCCNTRN